MVEPGGTIDDFRTWAKLLVGFAACYMLFQSVAFALGSDRGEAGILIAVAVIAALVGVEWWLFRTPLSEVLLRLGLGVPALRGLAAAAVPCALLLGVIPAVSLLEGSDFARSPEWAMLLPGLFAQAGIAEETLFRGYLFNHLRQGRGFWSAAFLSMLPFAAVHLALFAVLPWQLALASVLLAVVMSPPLAHLFVIGGFTIWPPALLHFVAQGALKVVDFPLENTILPLLWIGASAVLPYLVFVIPRRPEG